MRTIDADALLKKIEEDAEFYLVGDDENSKAVGSTLLSVMEQINAMPTVKPQRMKGKWINNYRCSVCGYSEKNYSDAPNNFCPVCGADIRGGQDESD